jgi:hypothetical protein
MMGRDQWQERILATVEHISSREYQLDAWFGRGNTVSSPDELFCELFDDLAFRLFFEKYSMDFTDVQKLAWKKLEDSLQSYAGVTPQKMDPKAVFNDGRWQEVREFARMFVEAFRTQGRLARR